MSNYTSTFTVQLQSGKTKLVKIVFDSELDKENYEADYYCDVYEKVQDWLNRNFPPERISDTGEDIEEEGCDVEPDHQEIINMCTKTSHGEK